MNRQIKNEVFIGFGIKICRKGNNAYQEEFGISVMMQYNMDAFYFF